LPPDFFTFSFRLILITTFFYLSVRYIRANVLKFVLHHFFQRERKQKKLYADEWALGDDEFESGRAFSVAEKLESPAFAQQGMVREMKGTDLSVA
jgi:hypothetical protein